MVSPFQLSTVLHSNLRSLPLPLRNNILLKDTIAAWRETRKRMEVPSGISPFLPIRGNPMLLATTHHEVFRDWERRGLTLLKDLCDTRSGKFKPYETIIREHDLPEGHKFYMAQVSSFVREICPRPHLRFQRSLVDKLVARDTLSTSAIYKPLLQYYTKPLADVMAKTWGKELPDVDLPHILLNGYEKTLAIMINETWRETQFKIMHRAYLPYYSPPNSQDKICPWCLTAKPSLFHRFWTCTSIQTFWSLTQSYIHSVTNIAVDLDPTLMVFGSEYNRHISTLAGGTAPTYLPQWVLICLLVARRVIMRNWISPSPPTIKEVQKELRLLLYKEILDSWTSKNHSGRHLHRRWDQYISTTFGANTPEILQSPFLFELWHDTLHDHDPLHQDTDEVSNSELLGDGHPIPEHTKTHEVNQEKPAELAL